MATHSSPLAWKIPWAQEPGRLQSVGLRRVRHDWVSNTLCDSLSIDWEKALATHSSTLAWKVAWTAEPGGLQSMGSWLSDFTFTFHFHALEKKMATHSSVLAWRIPGMAEPGGLLSMGLHRVGHDWSNLASIDYFCNFKDNLIKEQGTEM